MPWALWPPQSICRIESLERAGDGPGGTNDRWQHSWTSTRCHVQRACCVPGPILTSSVWMFYPCSS